MALALPAISWGYCETEAAKLKRAEEATLECERRSYDSSQMCASDRAQVEKIRTDLYWCEKVNTPKDTPRPSPCAELSSIRIDAINKIQSSFNYCRNELKKDPKNCFAFACNPFYEAHGKFIACWKENRMYPSNPPSADPCSRLRTQYGIYGGK